MEPTKYHVYSKLGLSSHAFNFASVHSIIVKDDNNTAIEFNRTVQYDLTFNGYRGYMFAGIQALYSWIMENIQTTESYNKEDLVRAYAIAVLDENNISGQKIGYTVRFTTAESESKILESEVFKQIVSEYSDDGNADVTNMLKNNIALMNYGFITKNMMSKLNFDNILFTMNTTKTPSTSIRKIDLQKEIGTNSFKDVSKYLMNNQVIDEYLIDLNYKYLKEEE